MNLCRKVGTESEWMPAFACRKAGCSRHYNVLYGYFKTLKDRIEPETKRLVVCPNDGQPMYIADFAERGAKRLWKCARLGCEASEETRGALS